METLPLWRIIGYYFEQWHILCKEWSRCWLKSSKSGLYDCSSCTTSGNLCICCYRSRNIDGKVWPHLSSPHLSVSHTDCHNWRKLSWRCPRWLSDLRNGHSRAQWWFRAHCIDSEVGKSDRCNDSSKRKSIFIPWGSGYLWLSCSTFCNVLLLWSNEHTEDSCIVTLYFTKIDLSMLHSIVDWTFKNIFISEDFN